MAVRGERAAPVLQKDPLEKRIKLVRNFIRFHVWQFAFDKKEFNRDDCEILSNE